jgi:hypothetical protein
MLQLEWKHLPAEETSWEVFRGHLLDPAHTRQRRTFESWNVYQTSPEGRSAEPLLSLKLDAPAGALHVVRGMECYVWEGYDAGGNVYLSRERRKWVRELVGTVRLADFPDVGELADEIIGLLFRAVVGTSRLPLSSVEAPLPAFSFGQLGYCYRPNATPDEGPLRDWRDLIREPWAAGRTRRERVKLFETFLHAVPFEEMRTAADAFGTAEPVAFSGNRVVDLLRTLFNEVSLSPYTDLVDKTLAFVAALEERGSLTTEERMDFLSHLLRQVGRHLTAYDLVTFHHRGANYPDALLLDAVLKDYLQLAERRPDLFGDKKGEDRTRRRRRRALRQGWLLRRRYEGHPVPDYPTSPGENNRVLPANHPRVPEEQILQPGRRGKRLYSGDPLPNYLGPHGAELLRQSMADLQDEEELRELGLGLFIDRPLGDGKAPGEPDGTLLLTSVAFSRSLASQRLRELAADSATGMDSPLHDRCQALLKQLDLHSLSVDRIGEPSRPGTVSLTDARRAAADFVFLHTTAGSVRVVLALFDFTPLESQMNLDFLTRGRSVLLARSADGSGLVVYDALLRPRVEMIVNTDQGYATRAGREYAVGGLSVVRIWEEGAEGTLQERELTAAPILIRVRSERMKEEG